MVMHKYNEMKYCWGIEEGSVCEDCKDHFVILWTSNGGIGRWKLTEVEKRIFGGDYKSGCMHK